jgi:hypothetical protein
MAINIARRKFTAALSASLAWPLAARAQQKRLHPNVLAIALANKLARIARGVLAHGRNFEARPNTNATVQAA